MTSMVTRLLCHTAQVLVINEGGEPRFKTHVLRFVGLLLQDATKTDRDAAGSL